MSGCKSELQKGVGTMENDTVKLLRECDAGLKMGARSIGEVLDYVKNDELRETLAEGKRSHEQLMSKTEIMLSQNGADSKSPAAMAKGMSWIKTNVKLAMNDSDKAIADLMTDGCNMGVKALYRYMNQYKEADSEARAITDDIIRLESGIADSMHRYL